MTDRSPIAAQLAASLYETTRLFPEFTVEVTFPPGTWVVDTLEQALTIPGVKVGLRLVDLWRKR